MLQPCYATLSLLWDIPEVRPLESATEVALTRQGQFGDAAGALTPADMQARRYSFFCSEGVSIG